MDHQKREEPWKWRKKRYVLEIMLKAVNDAKSFNNGKVVTE